jgi:hypothetical protein
VISQVQVDDVIGNEIQLQMQFLLFGREHILVLETKTQKECVLTPVGIVLV